MLRFVSYSLQRQQEMRSKGAQRTQNFNSMRSFRGARFGCGLPTGCQPLPLLLDQLPVSRL